MKVLVTGGTGFAGSHLVNLLVKNGQQVLATSNNGKVLSAEVQVISVDLMDSTAVSSINFKDIKAVYHLAGLAAVGSSFSQPQKYITVNSSIETNLFEECIKQKVTPRFLVVSSGNVYSPKAPLPLDEQSPVLPVSPYDVSKLTQEIIGEYYTSRGFEVVTSRSFNHVGPGQSEGFIVADLAKQIALAEKSGSGQLVCGNLDAKRDYTDVRDIAQAYASLVESGKPGEVYNICSGKSISGHDILAGLLAQTKVNIKVITDPALIRPIDVMDIYGSNDKIKKDTGWQPAIDLEQTLRETLDYWRAKV